MDYICYDEETQTVESMVFQKDGSIKRQTLMSNLAMDKRIYFCDFNADAMWTYCCLSAIRQPRGNTAIW